MFNKLFMTVKKNYLNYHYFTKNKRISASGFENILISYSECLANLFKNKLYVFTGFILHKTNF